MKVWITKYALTDGIIETEIETQDPVWTVFKNNTMLYTKNFGKDFHTSKEEAKLKAEEMRQKKIASLKKQIDKLERMRFE